MHCEVDGGTLLALWERALAQPPDARADALLAATAQEGSAAPSLAARNAQLATLHARWFGAELELLSHCPACGAAAQFSGDCAALAAHCSGDEHEAAQCLTMDDHRIEFRLPNAGDVAAASARSLDDDGFARALLERCVLASTRGGNTVAPGDLSLAVLDALSLRIEALSPGASVTFAVACPQCATPWEARLDLGLTVWQKVQGAAERLLLDVDTLARHYGWTEGDVLALSPTRRAAYIQLAAS